VLVFAVGVNHVLKFVQLFIHVLHPFIDTSTFVLADGVAVSLALHVIDAVELFHTLLANIVHVTVGAGGGVVSICIVAADTNVA
jgi:hypothetical protein